LRRIENASRARVHQCVPGGGRRQSDATGEPVRLRLTGDPPPLPGKGDSRTTGGGAEGAGEARKLSDVAKASDDMLGRLLSGGGDVADGESVRRAAPLPL
jgi:hypothetical protein